jgi:hypothetical protein
MTDLLLPSDIEKLDLKYAEDELIYLLYNAPNKEIPERMIKKKLLETLHKHHMIYSKNGFVGLNGIGTSYALKYIVDRHDFLPTVMLYWALEVLEKNIDKDAEIGIGIDGKSIGWEGAISFSQDILAGYRKYVKKRFNS